MSRSCASRSHRRIAFWFPALGLACQVDLERMLDQHKAEAYASSQFFADGQSMRRPPAHTVPVTRLIQPSEIVAGRANGVYVSHIPVMQDAELLARGEDRFRIFCKTCHGALGDGRSEVAENMKLRKPPSLHEERIREFLPGQLYRVISEGYGLMPAYGDELPYRDRWAVVAFVRALQLSQNVALLDLPPELQQEARPWL